MNLTDQRIQILQLSNRLDQFHQVRPDLWNCRCPICGDSKKDPYKKRFFIYKKPAEGYYSVKCHNCHHAGKFMTFFKNQFPALWDQVIIEKYKPERKVKREAILVAQTNAKPMTLNQFTSGGYDYTRLTRLCDLPRDHKAIKELEKRQIPKKWWDKHIMYCEDFHAFLQHVGEHDRADRYEGTNKERLILPFYDEHGESYVFQGRDLSGESKLRYITIKKNDAVSKVWGMDRIDPKKPVLVLEGALDAMFLPQAIAMSGSLVRTKDELNKIFVLDNEPRNHDICNIMSKCLTRGSRVVLWPSFIKQKDINEMVLGGLSVKQILKVIFEYQVSGLAGKMALEQWRKDRK